MFRSIVLFLYALFSVSADAEENLTLWYSHQDNSFINLLVNEFKKENDINISLVQFDPEKIKAEILLGAQYGGLPELVIFPSDFVGLHRLMKLSRIPDDWFLSDISPSAKVTAFTDGKYWGVPVIQGNNLLLYYNKKLVPEPVKSWEALLAKKQQYIDNNILPIGWNYQDMYYFIPFLSAFNGWPITNNKITLNTPEMVAALKYYRYVSEQKMVNEQCEYTCSQADFIQGKEAYAINGDWAYQDLKNNMGDNLGVALLPTIDGKQMRSMKSTFVISLPNYSVRSKQKRKLIEQFVKFVQRPTIQKLVYEKTHLLPVSEQLLNEYKKQAKGSDKVLFEQFELSKPMPSSIKMSIAWQAIAIGFKRYEDGLSAEESAKYMQHIAIQQMRRLKNE
ncbi:sugar ABC transporter substrate-binding protein [Photobacterium lucens]|uniref:sugar ABC transporter substrate-binding protein n=1 Tax=Photobacterium lucens TaxID=2562949 RepID=UPI0006B48870|nr:extracellular solute-binding protein [Photobacterium lucens]KPA53930.1 ABC transporter substrate-binding protein [Photobacterium leiognathi subsp. mandapamensis]MBP2701519.1 extracellular solute-binding protein [Vibrio parahaemolyticus]MZG57928.1 extracellular solute-binding protein [Photobacterium lucens]MZG80533.1 extracellular solute-binding protein [Photobacterium lucens]PSV22412.1 ABC transporter substrate-binding protein [Photobacterium leiognathi subsp. mandapamensis]